MNERLKQIIKQSTNPDWDGDDGYANELNLEKFAKNIVLECMELNAGELAYTKWFDLTQIYKKHFGVE